MKTIFLTSYVQLTGIFSRRLYPTELLLYTIKKRENVFTS